jgi:ubiquinone/menaquinone biosynthesis C-methylase UbiE
VRQQLIFREHFQRGNAEQGAAAVLGLDLSQNMIERARADTTDAAIKYCIADLETLDLPESAFDLAYSSLAFHYVQDLAASCM